MLSGQWWWDHNTKSVGGCMKYLSSLSTIWQVSLWQNWLFWMAKIVGKNSKKKLPKKGNPRHYPIWRQKRYKHTFFFRRFLNRYFSWRFAQNGGSPDKCLWNRQEKTLFSVLGQNNQERPFPRHFVSVGLSALLLALLQNRWEKGSCWQRFLLVYLFG